MSTVVFKSNKHVFADNRHLLNIGCKTIDQLRDLCIGIRDKHDVSIFIILDNENRHFIYNLIKDTDFYKDKKKRMTWKTNQPAIVLLHHIQEPWPRMIFASKAKHGCEFFFYISYE